MTYLQDIIHAVKGVVAPVALIMVGAMILSISATPYGDRGALVGLGFFLTGLAWVVYLSFFSRD